MRRTWLRSRRLQSHRLKSPQLGRTEKNLSIYMQLLAWLALRVVFGNLPKQLLQL